MPLPRSPLGADRTLPRLRALLEGAAGLVRTLGGLARDLALPPLCPTCRAPVAGVGLCGPCWARMPFIARPFCDRRGVPFAYDAGRELSSAAVESPPISRRTRAVAVHDGVARDLVHALKYQDRTDLAPLMGGLMAHAGADVLAEADLIIPVPLHWRRSLARRFNQAALLARAIGRTAGRPVAYDVLRRTRATAHQVGLTRQARADNVAGAFAVAPAADPAISGRHLVLIDDVVTSGATTDACARALLRAGARTVDVVVFARVVDSG